MVVIVYTTHAAHAWKMSRTKIHLPLQKLFYKKALHKNREHLVSKFTSKLYIKYN